jgi:SAM-dependent methyltransferase
MSAHLTANVERFNGFSSTYDKNRPQPPLVILDILNQMAQVEWPRLVVDLGSGTGLSTRIWSKRAALVLGIEPNADMRHEAELQTSGLPNVRYQAGYSHKTGLPDACADIVTCSQSLHWMEPAPTFAEIARILRPGGVFAAYDCDWPPTLNSEAESAYNSFVKQAEEIGKQRGWYAQVVQWKKEEHLSRIRACGQFRYVKEIVAHHIEE